MISANEFRTLVSAKYLTTVVQPGESVGLLAAQGVGEPSTQMTLNTFHLAGHGGANVTLGIPRLREILMTASDHIRTPLMELPLLGDAKHDKAKATQLSNRFNRVMLSDVVQSIAVTERVVSSRAESGMDIADGKIEMGSEAVRRYEIELSILDSDELERSGGTVTWASIASA